jgi:DNA repair protein RadC
MNQGVAIRALLKPYRITAPMPSDNYTIHDMPADDRPRERLLQQGADALSTGELLAIILRTGTTEENALQLAGRILIQHQGLRGLARIGADELAHIKGVGKAKAAQIIAALELGRRASLVQTDERQQISRAEDAAALVMDMCHLQQEQIRVIVLDNSRRVVAIPTVYIGTVNMAVLRVSEIFREAILRNSPAVIMVHNHPSGNPMPSPEDIDITRTLIAAGELLDIQFIDHLIIAQDGWKSLRELNLGFN